MNPQLLRDAYLAACDRVHARDLKKRIKIALIEYNLTLRDLARACGVSTPLISMILNHRYKGYRHRPKIARALGLSVAELFGESNGKRRAA